MLLCAAEHDNKVLKIDTKSACFVPSWSYLQKDHPAILLAIKSNVSVHYMMFACLFRLLMIIIIIKIIII